MTNTKITKKSINSIIKCEKLYSIPLKDAQIKEIENMIYEYEIVKNYFFSRYSGIYSMTLTKDYRGIRNKIVANNDMKNFKLQGKMWKACLNSCCGNIQSMWVNLGSKCKVVVRENSNLTDNEKAYLKYVFSALPIWETILQYKSFEETDKLKEFNITEDRKHYLFNLIRRYTRKYKPEVAHSTNTKTISFEQGMYSIKDGVFSMMSLNKGKKINIILRNKINKSKGTILVILNKDIKCLEIHYAIHAKYRHPELTDAVVGIDKGYTKMISCSTGKEYGEKLGEILTKETERLNILNKKRNPYYAKVRELQKVIDNSTDEEQIKLLQKKIDNIKNNNLGKVKYNNKKHKVKEQTKSYINAELNKFFKDTKPKEIVLEDLTFVSNAHKYRGKKYNRKMTRWVKGTIEERLEYKAACWGTKVTVVNPAYTSQYCHICGKHVNRNNNIIKCPSCGTLDANINAAKNILHRKQDKEITLYTPYKKVKNILETRIA